MSDDEPLTRGRTICLDVNRAVDKHAGLSVRDDVARGCVVVKSTVKNDEAARHGLAPSDAIVSINGFPAVHHRDVIAVVQHCTEHGFPVVLRVSRGMKRRHTHCMRTLRDTAVSFHVARDAWSASHTQV